LIGEGREIDIGAANYGNARTLGHSAHRGPRENF
jgi:hypothetical protein